MSFALRMDQLFQSELYQKLVDDKWKKNGDYMYQGFCVEF